MIYREIYPGERLKRYIKCYFILCSETIEDFSDTIFPGGHIEIVFNLDDAKWQSSFGGSYNTDPPVELLGQFTAPIKIKSKGKNMMLGIRFHSPAAAYFFREPLSEFSNQISDCRDIAGAQVRYLHQQLLDTPHLSKRIRLIEDYLMTCVNRADLNSPKLLMLESIVKDMHRNLLDNTIDAITLKYRITPRYLQKLFLQHIGVTPKLYSRINRFQQSLKCLRSDDASLTSIAYECGYYDQSHFIKEFKSFTGGTPSRFQLTLNSNI